MSRGTSPESREAMRFGEKDRLRTVTLEYIRRCREQGGTADEICAALNLGHNSIAPRIVELKPSGLVVELFEVMGKRVRRKTRAGCSAGVVIASELADPSAHQWRGRCLAISAQIGAIANEKFRALSFAL